jgi:3-carboxy-cis,cis-muconate cycloisomerase
MAGRTRTQIAVPPTLGLRIAGWMLPMVRCRDRLDELRPRLMVVQMGGAVGNLSALGADGIAVMDGLAAELNLTTPAKPWHTERDGIVELGNWLAMVAGLCGRMGADLLISGRSEIAEMRAGEGGGSSTMPHKANPVGAEALVTLARQAAGQAAQLQSALIHAEDRDGPAWVTEWLTLPPLLVATGAALGIASDLANSLAPDAAAMRLNMESGGGAIHAEALAFALAAQMPLAEAQGIVKEAARQSGETLV